MSFLPFCKQLQEVVLDWLLEEKMICFSVDLDASWTSLGALVLQVQPADHGLDQAGYLPEAEHHLHCHPDHGGVAEAEHHLGHQVQPEDHGLDQVEYQPEAEYHHLGHPGHGSVAFFSS
jgi:hypothetical protein